MSLGGWSIDKNMLALFVRARRTQVLKLTDRQAAVDAGVSASTIVRAEKCERLAAENFLALCLWLGVDPLAFLVDPATQRHVPSRRFAVSRDFSAPSARPASPTDARALVADAASSTDG